MSDPRSWKLGTINDDDDDDDDFKTIVHIGKTFSTLYSEILFQLL